MFVSRALGRAKKVATLRGWDDPRRTSPQALTTQDLVFTHKFTNTNTGSTSSRKTRHWHRQLTNSICYLTLLYFSRIIRSATFSFFLVFLTFFLFYLRHDFVTTHDDSWTLDSEWGSTGQYQETYFFLFFSVLDRIDMSFTSNEQRALCFNVRYWVELDSTLHQQAAVAWAVISGHLPSYHSGSRFETVTIEDYYRAHCLWQFGSHQWPYRLTPADTIGLNIGQTSWNGQRIQ